MTPPRVVPADDELLRRVRGGDRAALQSLLHKLLPRVRQVLHRYLGPNGDFDDATQEAMIALASSLSKFEGRSSLNTFVRTIVTRVAYRHFAKPGKPKALQLVAAPVDEISPESQLLGREALRRLHACLETLSAPRRAAFVLCCIEGMSPSDAAAELGVSRIAMRSRLYHARKEVAAQLRDDPYIGALIKEASHG